MVGPNPLQGAIDRLVAVTERALAMRQALLIGDAPTLGSPTPEAVRELRDGLDTIGLELKSAVTAARGVLDECDSLIQRRQDSGLGYAGRW